MWPFDQADAFLVVCVIWCLRPTIAELTTVGGTVGEDLKEPLLLLYSESPETDVRGLVIRQVQRQSPCFFHVRTSHVVWSRYAVFPEFQVRSAEQDAILIPFVWPIARGSEE